MKRKISIKELAQITGTSATTVSFVMNGKAEEMRISKTVADKILKAAKQHGYSPNPLAVSLRTGHSNIIMVLVESVSGNFFATLARVVEEEAERYGYKVMYCSTDNNLDKTRDTMKLLRQMNIEGYIVTPVAGMQEDIQLLQAQGKSVVMVDSYLDKVDAPHVLVDNFDGVLTGMAHLAEAGYRNIGFVTADLSLVQMSEREKAYKKGLQNNKLPFDKKAVLKIPYGVSREQLVQSIADYLEKHTVLDALFFATNYLGIAGLEAIGRQKVKVPKEMGMICFDDHEAFHTYPGGITVIEQPIEDIARTSVELLMQQLGKKAAAASVNKGNQKLPPKLIVRGSTKKPVR